MKPGGVWILVMYHGSSGDEVRAFGRQRDAQAAAISYAREHWPDGLGSLPSGYDDVVDAWDDYGLWGSFDSRWELVNVRME